MSRPKRQRTGLGAALRWSRHQRGLSQRQLAELVGVHTNTVIRLETGTQTGCRPELFQRLTIALHAGPETVRGKTLLYLRDHPETDPGLVRRSLEYHVPLPEFFDVDPLGMACPDNDRLSVWTPGKTA